MVGTHPQAGPAGVRALLNDEHRVPPTPTRSSPGGRVPVLVFAGTAPYTLRNELPGSRNEFIHWIQHLGWQFTTVEQNPTLAAADVVLVLDSDVPYRPSRHLHHADAERSIRRLSEPSSWRRKRQTPLPAPRLSTWVIHSF